MLNRIITAAPTTNSSVDGEEHISRRISKHEAHGSVSNNCSKLASMPNFGHSNGHNISNNNQHHQQQLIHLSTPSNHPSSLTISTVMSSPHVKYHHHMEVSNNLHVGAPTHAIQHSSSSSAATTDVSPTSKLISHSSSNSSSTTSFSFPISQRTISNSNTKSKEESQTFIVDYMFKETAGIKKSKKIKRKYEFKRKDSVSSESEKPLHVKVSYILMEDEDLNACGTMNEAIEKHFNANETSFDFSKDQQVSIIQVDSNVKLARKRTVENITTHEMIRILHLTQQQACNLLGCSLSTIKRKFYSIRNELGIDKWPHNYLEYQNCSFFNDFYPMSLKFILNDEESTIGHDESNS